MVWHARPEARAPADIGHVPWRHVLDGIQPGLLDGRAVGEFLEPVNLGTLGSVDVCFVDGCV
jgi:hypothetical protein